MPIAVVWSLTALVDLAEDAKPTLIAQATPTHAPVTTADAEPRTHHALVQLPTALQAPVPSALPTRIALGTSPCATQEFACSA